MNEKFGVRVKCSEQDPSVRISNFEEVSLGYTAEQAVKEAQRCLSCKKPRCVSACPVSIDIPSFISEIAAGNFTGAAQIIAKDSLLPAVCGRVCPQEKQCEGNCILGIKGEPVAIGALERYVGDKTTAKKVEIIPNGKKVAIVGSGCAGMTAAADLRNAGFEVSIFEALHEFGGVLRYGIPPFRLPRTVLDREIKALQDMGVKFFKNVVVGKSITIKQLQEKYGKFFKVEQEPLEAKLEKISAINFNLMVVVPVNRALLERLLILANGNSAIIIANFQHIAVIQTHVATNFLGDSNTTEVINATNDSIRCHNRCFLSYL